MDVLFIVIAAAILVVVIIVLLWGLRVLLSLVLTLFQLAIIIATLGALAFIGYTLYESPWPELAFGFVLCIATLPVVAR